MKKIFQIIFCCCVVIYATAQSPSVFDFTRVNSFNPSLLVGPDYTVMFGVEQRLKSKLALVLDAGYIFQSSFFQGEHVLKGVSGFNLRPGVKLYTKENKRFYWQMQVFYKQVNYKIYDWLGKSCVNEIPTYEQLQNFTYRKQTVSINVMVGTLFRISDAILLELYEGLGIKFKNQQPTEATACYRNNERGIFLNFFRENSVTPNLAIGIKLLVRLK